MTGCSLLFTMKACGQTMFMISCRTSCEAADVLMLKPARSSSRAMVAVPPDDDDAFTDAPLEPGATTVIEADNAIAARAAKAERGSSHLMCRTLLRSGRLGCRSGSDPARPGLASFDRLKVVLEQRDDTLATTARCGCGLAHGVVQHDPVPALTLGVQQGVVRPPQDGGQLFAGLAFGDAEAHGELREAADRDGGVELGAHAC